MILLLIIVPETKGGGWGRYVARKEFIEGSIGLKSEKGCMGDLVKVEKLGGS